MLCCYVLYSYDDVMWHKYPRVWTAVNVAVWNALKDTEGVVQLAQSKTAIVILPKKKKLIKNMKKLKTLKKKKVNKVWSKSSQQTNKKSQRGKVMEKVNTVS